MPRRMGGALVVLLLGLQLLAPASAFFTPKSAALVSQRRHPSRRAERAAGGGVSMMFDRISEALSQAGNVLSGKQTLTENNVNVALGDVKRALLDADVNLRVANDLIKNVKEKALGTTVTEGVNPEQQFVKCMYDELVTIMGTGAAPLADRRPTDAEGKPTGAGDRPTVVLLAGLQGAGKTTAAGKLAKFCTEDATAPRKVLLAACDVYRPAAIKQLQLLGEQVGVEVYSEGTDADPREIAANALAKARDEGYDTLIVDTAGRQVIDDDLMTELKDVKSALDADETLLVVDSMTGQEAATLTARFDGEVGITGAVLTKLDGDTRGGAALSVRAISGRPIKFVGVGEKLDALETFYPERMASRILGMGDVVSLVEKMEKEVSDKEAAAITQKMLDQTFDFDDFLKQSRMVSNMGSMAGVMKMLPGMAGKINDDQLRAAEKRLVRAESLISSMTKAERRDPELLIRDRSARSRLIRIANGSGNSLEDATAFLSEFQQMRTMMSRMGKTMLSAAEQDGSVDASMMNPEALAQGGNREMKRMAKRQAKKSAKGAATSGFGGGGGGGKKKRKR